MNTGYVLPCDSSSLDECLRARRFACSSDPGVAKEIGEDSVVLARATQNLLNELEKAPRLNQK